jgi:2-methylcitrate dehydratase
VDALTEQLAGFAADLTLPDVPPAVVEAAETCLLDTIGCAIGGIDTATTRIVRATLPGFGGGVRGRVLGAAGHYSTGEAAALVNGVMIRDLDFNDWYPGGHPSDCTGALLAVAEHAGADGPRLLTSTIVAYEVFARLCAAAPLKQRGWDQGFGVSVATAAALGNLLRLDRERTAHAIAIAAVAHLPMRATKAGQLSLWKGAATAHAARTALLCTLLAAEGMTGPEAVFEGRNGLWELVSGRFEIAPFGKSEEDFLVPNVSFKYWPVCYGLQAPATAALRLRDELPLSETESIVVETYQEAYDLNGGDPAKWDPRNRATADHSIPYAIVWIMRHGTVDESAFAEPAYTDPALRPLMDRIEVRVAPDLAAAYPADVGVRLTATATGGATHRVAVTNPPGHEKNPMSRAQVEEKFHRLVAPHTGAQRAGEAARWWGCISGAGRLDEGFRLLAGGSGQ